MYHQDLECYIKKFKVELHEAILDKEAFREEVRNQRLKVAKLEERNLEAPEIRQELKDSRTMVHANDVENQEFGMQLQNIKGRHERLRINRVDLAKELEKDKHDRKKPLEAWTRLEEFGDVEDLLTLEDQTPVIYLR